MKKIFNFQFLTLKKVRSRKLEPESFLYGFTLVELLIVIAIVGMLVGFLSMSFFGVRQKSRDAQRKTDLQIIQSALEQYRADNDEYIDKTEFDLISCGSSFTGPAGTIYLQSLPCDPADTSQNRYYYYKVSSFNYFLASCVENADDSSAVKSEPSDWPGGAQWPPLTCSSGSYYIVRNP